MTKEEMLDMAKDYSEIHSEIGLRSYMDIQKNMIKDKYFEIVEVEAGRLYNPNMKEGWLKELNCELEYEKEQLDMLHVALKLRLEK